MKQPKPGDIKKYQALLKSHLSDPLSGIEDQDLQWLIAFEEQYEQPARLIREQMETAKYENIHAAQTSEQQLRENEKVQAQLNHLAPKLKSAFDIDVQSGNRFGNPVASFWRFLKNKSFPGSVDSSSKRGAVLKPAMGLAAVIAAGVIVYLALFRSQPTPVEDVYDPMAFEQNAYLENLIDAAYRSSQFTVTFESPAMNENITTEYTHSEFNLSFSGRVKGAVTKHDNPFILKIYNNDVDAYLNERPVLKKNLNLKAGPEMQSIKQSFDVQLKPGLYYYTFENADNVYYAGKFFVNRKP